MSESPESDSGSSEDLLSEAETAAEYHGIKINHKLAGEAPELYVISSSAVDLDEWAEVPRANTNFMNGYQRQLKDSRLDEISGFLETAENIIPGAVLVTVNENDLIIEESDNGGVDIGIKSMPDKDLNEKITDAYEALYERLSERGKEYVDNIDIDENEEDGSTESTGSEDDEGIDEETEQDQSTGQMDGEAVSYLARKTGDLKEKISDLSDLSSEEKAPLEEYAERISKPGFIIDGQHRVHGGKRFPGEINYPIVLIPGLEAKEQVYHFYIINDKAEPISQEELLITVSTALSETESEDLFDRLITAGVDADKARYPYRADVEKSSPFYQMVDYSEKVGDQTGVFSFKDIHMLMNRFVEMKGVNSILTDEIEEWQIEDEDFRINKFYVFWDAIKDHYSDLWDDAVAAKTDEADFEDKAPEQFFQKDAMRVFQQYILEELADKQKNRNEWLEELQEEMDQESIDIWEQVMESDEVFREATEDVIDDIPPEFFKWEWNTAGLSTSENRQNLLEELEGAAETNNQGMSNFRIFNKGF